MLIHKNIQSRMHFIYLKDIDWETFKVITPLNQIKIVERSLFEEAIEGDGDSFMNNGWITPLQLKLYNDYKRDMEEDSSEFKMEDTKPKRKLIYTIKKKNYTTKLITKRQGNNMKTIQIDDVVYAYLENHAIPFKEPSPNHVLRRLLGITSKTINKPTAPETQTVRTPKGQKAPKTSLTTLTEYGFVSEGQKLFFDYKSHQFSKEYVAKISGDKLLYEGYVYTMSGLVAEILDAEGCGIPSKAYRGPEYWVTEKGVSIKELWDKYLNK